MAIEGSDTVTKLNVTTNGNGRAPWWVYSVSEFIKTTGFPILMALLMSAFIWFHAIKNNELMVKLGGGLDRIVTVLERVEKRLEDKR